MEKVVTGPQYFAYPSTPLQCIYPGQHANHQEASSPPSKRQRHSLRMTSSRNHFFPFIPKKDRRHSNILPELITNRFGPNRISHATTCVHVSDIEVCGHAGSEKPFGCYG